MYLINLESTWKISKILSGSLIWISNIPAKLKAVQDWLEARRGSGWLSFPHAPAQVAERMKNGKRTAYLVKSRLMGRSLLSSDVWSPVCAGRVSGQAVLLPEQGLREDSSSLLETLSNPASYSDMAGEWLGFVNLSNFKVSIQGFLAWLSYGCMSRRDIYFVS